MELARQVDEGLANVKQRHVVLGSTIQQMGYLIVRNVQKVSQATSVQVDPLEANVRNTHNAYLCS